MIYLNEIDPFCCEWLRALDYGHVDNRSIKEVQPNDLRGFTQCHWFAGIAGWPAALALAGWPSDREVWTGSCPCQPFSTAGKRKTTADERHLWPEMFRLIKECRPATVMGEQVSSKDGLAWLDGVFADLESIGYTCWACDLPAGGIEAPQRRQRLWWLADANQPKRRRRSVSNRGRQSVRDPSNGGINGSLVESRSSPSRHDDARESVVASAGEAQQPGCVTSEPGRRGGVGSVVLANSAGLQSGRIASATNRYGNTVDATGGNRPLGNSTALRRTGSDGTSQQERGTGTTSPWADYLVADCSDGHKRRFERGSFPLAHGIPRDVGPIIAWLSSMGVDSKTAKRLIALARRNRTGRLRGYGNAIVAPLAAEFIRAYLERT